MHDRRMGGSGAEEGQENKVTQKEGVNIWGWFSILRNSGSREIVLRLSKEGMMVG